MRRLGAAIGGVWVLVAALAPWVAPYDASVQHRGRAYAPPTRLRFTTAEGRLAAPHFHPVRLVSALERRFEEDPARRVDVRLFVGGRMFGSADRAEPILMLGADSLGRDVFSRLAVGARTSLALALFAATLATLIGVAVGLVAGAAGGVLDGALTRVSDVVLVLPALYVVVALRAALPVVLSPTIVFILLTTIFALVAWPVAARGVRAIVRSERMQGYVEAAWAAGARRRRVLFRHLLPAARGYACTQFALLVPSCLLFEGALSFAGLGFTEDAATWGTMLQDAGNIGALATAPWLLAPAVAIVTVVLAINLLIDSTGPRRGVGIGAHARVRLAR
jgi:peptide/nickel transport system permease protein